MTDPVADLLTRIRNAQIAKHESLVIPHSKMKEGIVKTLHGEGFLGAFKVIPGESGRKEIHVALRYSAKKEPMIAEIIRKSRPGRRVYLGYGRLRPVRNGVGIAILSTPKGILTDRQAREKKVGGEFLCTVW